MDSQGLRFYLYDFEATRLCKSGAELLTRAKALSFERAQHLGAALFLHQQLADDPMRTVDPEEASLFVVPSIFVLTASDWSLPHTAGLCDAPPVEVISKYTEDLLASPYYHRHKGKDHLLVQTDFASTALLLMTHGPGTPGQHAYAREHLVRKQEDQRARDRLNSVLDNFRKATRNFVITSRIVDGACNKGYVHHWAEPTARTMAVPYLDPSALAGCTMNQHGRIICQEAGIDQTFEEYRQRRNVTLFFYGHCQRKEGRDNVNLRHQLLTLFREGGRWSPTFIADSRRPKGSELPPCIPDARGGVAACAAGPLAPQVLSHKIRQSLLALHVRGDDSSSSRFYQTLATGTPQLILAPDFYNDAAPFKCRVDYRKSFYFLDVGAFQKRPAETIDAALETLLGDPHDEALRRLWKAQKETATDLLWHVPGSRVARNLVEEALRLAYSRRRDARAEHMTERHGPA